MEARGFPRRWTRRPLNRPVPVLCSLFVLSTPKRRSKHDHVRRDSVSRVKIADHAKSIKWGAEQCENCGYDRHVDVAHVRAVSDFPKDAKLIEVNAQSNLLYLCPNCHREFDNGGIVEGWLV